MSDKKPDWHIPKHDPDKVSGAKKRAAIWSSGPKNAPEQGRDRFNFREFDEARGRKSHNKSHNKSQSSEHQRPSMSGKKRLVFFFIALAIGYFILKVLNPDISIFDTPYGVKSLVIIVLFGGSMAYFSRASKSAVLKSLFGWLLIVSVTFGLYNMGKGDTYTTMADINPSRTVSQTGEMMVERQRDGHFWIMTQINGQNLPMMVDTGASMVVLSKQDARRMGIKLDDLRFTGSSLTANGRVSFARTRLDSFQIGHLNFNNFIVTVNGGQMQGSLLGLDALDKFTSYEMRGDTMILRP